VCIISGILNGKAAVITGAGRGLGRAFALAFAGQGASVLVNDLGTEMNGEITGNRPADETVAEITAKGGKAVANYESVAAVEGGEKIINACVENFGKIDILVNNAGILRDHMIWNMTPEEWDTVLKVHLYGVFNCTKPAVIMMKQQGSGRIINITSPTVVNGAPGQSNYGTAKAGILGFTRVLARELGRYGITVNALLPVAATRMTDFFDEEVKKTIPLAEDNAPVVAYLASDAAANINGQVIGSNGGLVSLYTPAPVIVKTICKDGRWTVEELAEIMPATLEADMVGPEPPKPPK